MRELPKTTVKDQRTHNPLQQHTSNPTHEWSDGLDDIDRAVRVSTKKVMKFWYIPDLKNTQLRNIADSRLPHPNDPLKF